MQKYISAHTGLTNHSYKQEPDYVKLKISQSLKSIDKQPLNDSKVSGDVVASLGA